MKEREGLRSEMDRIQMVIYEIELSAELQKLEADFENWKNGTLTVFQLNQKIHAFHSGPNKELFLKYERPSFADINIAQAIMDGKYDINDLSEELRPMIQKRLQAFL